MFFPPSHCEISAQQCAAKCCNVLKIMPPSCQALKTGGKTWVYDYDPETKQMLPQWKMPSSPRPKKARQVRSNLKTMPKAFFHVEGLVHHAFLPQGHNMNQTIYRTMLQCL
jgi:hypothetical protein